jgi:tetratricopeptide (TPR) repeat protein
MRAAAVFLAATALAQHQHTSNLEKPPTLLPRMGTHSHPIATLVPDAQRFFDQGLNMLYGFNRYEALRSFRRAAELDPKALLPHWGMAAAQGPHINMDADGDVKLDAYCAGLLNASGLKAAAPEPERALFDAAAARCPGGNGPAYSAAMRNLARRYPDDLDVLTLFAESLMIPVRWRWWTLDGKPAAGTGEAIAVLEQVLRRNPDHPGANHFYIHAVEASPTPERAIPSAQRLMGIVPAAGHLVHMPGHIWLVLGDYEMTAAVNERAAQADRDYFASTGITTSAYAGYYVHNLHFVAVARAMQGRKHDAIKAARETAQSALPYVTDMPMMVDAFIPLPWFALLRFQQWDEMLRETPPHAKLLTATAMFHYARATALAALQRSTEARLEHEFFRQAAAKVPADWLWINNKSRDMAALAGAVLDARLAPGYRDAIPHWRRALKLEDALVYDEPPPWFFPIRESLGAALLRSGDAAQAEQVFREGLRLKPRNGRMLFGLLASLENQNKTAPSEMVRREFETAWKRADVRLSLDHLW